jgi:hypothetical protein
MKHLVTIIIVILMSTCAVWADTHIRESHSQVTYSRGEVIGSQHLRISEIWFTNKRATLREAYRAIIIDHEADKFYFLNHETKKYIEAPLPLDFESLITEELKQHFREETMTGRVRKTSKKREVLGRACTEYRANLWTVRGRGTSNRQHFKVWATLDVPFDLKPYYELLDYTRIVYNRDEALRGELEEVRGVQMRVEMKILRFGSDTRYVSEVIEIVEKDQPRPVYKPPKNYKPQDLITAQDLGLQ